MRDSVEGSGAVVGEREERRKQRTRDFGEPAADFQLKG
jgi:hypothetical protein